MRRSCLLASRNYYFWIYSFFFFFSNPHAFQRRGETKIYLGFEKKVLFLFNERRYKQSSYPFEDENQKKKEKDSSSITWPIGTWFQRQTHNLRKDNCLLSPSWYKSKSRRNYTYRLSKFLSALKGGFLHEFDEWRKMQEFSWSLL